MARKTRLTTVNHLTLKVPIPQNGQIHSNHLWGWRVKGQGKITVNDIFLTEQEHKKIIFKKLKVMC